MAANQITGKTARSGREKGGDNRAAGESVAAVERRYMMNEPEEAAALSVKIRMTYKRAWESGIKVNGKADDLGQT